MRCPSVRGELHKARCSTAYLGGLRGCRYSLLALRVALRMVALMSTTSAPVRGGQRERYSSHLISGRRARKDVLDADEFLDEQ